MQFTCQPVTKLRSEVIPYFICFTEQLTIILVGYSSEKYNALQIRQFKMEQPLQ